MKKISVLLLTLLCIISVSAQVQWSSRIDSISPHKAILRLTADIAMRYHIYGLPTEMAGDQFVQPTEISIDPVDGLTLVGPVTVDTKPHQYADPDLGVNVPVYSGKVTFSQEISWQKDGIVHVSGVVRAMACDDNSCTPPKKYKFDLPFGSVNQVAKVIVNESQAATNQSQPQDMTPETNGVQSTTPLQAPDSSAEALELMQTEEIIVDTNNNSLNNSWWEPVDTTTANSSNQPHGYLAIFFIGLVGGLLALLTPCVWPMIPMTMSFFLKKGRSRGKSIADAVTYGLSIVVIYLLLGIGITLLFGASQLNKIATSATFNLIFFALLVIFAISFFGAFDIKLPSKWSNKMDSRAESTSGMLSIFFMAFTLVLVSFSCTGPIIGTLLVEAASQSSILGPAIGMGGFALGLALPFGLFAFFPSLLKEMPKSGGWLNSVKVVLGFIELILSLKFLSVADLAYGWHILDREVFLSLWIVLFVLLGLYLLGKLRFSHDAPSTHTSVTGFFLALISLSFAIYLVPGLWGAPLKSISAFAPPLTTQDFNLYGGTLQEYDNYDEGMEFAREMGKPVFLDFSGYACVNCRKMEGAVFDTEQIRNIIENGFVTITLMVDDRTPLPKPVVIEENGEKIELEEVGELWSYLQRHKFGTTSQPYYVLLDNEGRPLMPSRAYDEDVNAFAAWLNEGADKYQNLSK